MTFPPPAPHARRSRAALAVALCVGAAAVLSGCAEEDPDAGTNGLGKLTAQQIEAKAQSAASAAKAVRLSGTLVSKGVSYKLNMRLKQDGAAGSVATRNSRFELLRIGDVLYMKAGAEFWRRAESTGEPTKEDVQAAEKLDGKYVKVPQDDPSYKLLRGFTEKNVLVSGLTTLHGETVKGDRDSIAGKRTIKVAGGPHGEGGTLDVALEGTPYPMRFARGGGAGVVVLTDWDMDFALDPPAKDDTLDYGKQLPRTSG
ncbi:hypothetical protein [Streptomyces sp. CC77]|uniref:hypothetical protein n=1 Tax=Streptomyces sp. CC77 TaxID=1906739 RepID=UPI0008DD1566|nr:hypothetical protein [Streptomyces sp. CC77]OII70296.1 hypothetical protein BJP39_02925 [Streptomyces sp. CC77]